MSRSPRLIGCGAAALLVAGLAGCSSSGGTGGPTTPAPTTEPGSSSNTASSTPSTPPPAAKGWQVIPLLDDKVSDGGLLHSGNSVVTGIDFADASHGTISLAGSNDTSQDGGAIEQLSSPTTIAKITVPGFTAGLDGQPEDFLGLQRSSAGLVALSSFGQLYFASADGSTWSAGKLDSGVPNAGQVWLAPDKSGTWHLVDTIGNVWTSPTAPSATTTWTRTWQPEGSDPDPAQLPTGACGKSLHQTYYARDFQRAFFVSSDGETMMYGNGLGDNPSGVCRSTDGGKSFYPVTFPDPPGAGSAEVPYVLEFFDDRHGFAVRANGDAPGSAFAYTTSDGGATWTAATLPTSVTSASSPDNIASGFTAPDGRTAYLVGFGDDALLLRSDDAGRTWTDDSAGLAGKFDGAGIKLHTGFALDAEHIWVGGDGGTLAYSATGGK